MMYWENGHMDAGWGIVMMLMMLAFWVLVTLAVVWAVRSTRTPHAAAPPQLPPGTTVSAEQILAERLARGEIEPEDYQARLNALKPSGRPS